MPFFFAAAGLVVLGAAAGYLGLMHLGFGRRPAHDVEAYLASPARPGSVTVVCAGDSLTHATLSADYVARLRARFAGRGYAFVNAGANGHASRDLLARLDWIAACRPAAVSVLIGTNDARAEPLDGAARTFRENLDRILTRLRGELGVEVAVLSIPPLGDDRSSEESRAVEHLNAILHELARAHGARYLPLHESLRPLLSRRVPRPGSAFWLTASVAFRRYVARQSWDAIARAQGSRLFTDQIHLSDRAADAIVDQLARWLVHDVPKPSASAYGTTPASEASAAAPGRDDART